MLTRDTERPAPSVDDGATSNLLEVTVMWGDTVLTCDHLRGPRSYTVGDLVDQHGRNCTDFTIDRVRLGCERLTLATFDGETALVQLQSVATRVHHSEQQTSATPGVVTLNRGEVASVALCELSFRFELVRAPDANALRAAVASGKRDAQPWTTASLAAHLLVLGLFYFLPPHSLALSMDDSDAHHRLVKFAIAARSQEPPLPSFLDAPVTDDSAQGGEGSAAPGETGTMGQRDAPRAPRRMATRGEREVPAVASAPSAQDARDAGILGLLRASSLKASIFDAAAAEGSDAADTLGSVLADRTGEEWGIGGIGPIGPGRGGGGPAHGTIGVNDLSTIGSHDGRNRGGRYGRGGPGLREHFASVPGALNREVQVVGSLAKETIRRVIHRHLAEVRHCYEQSLVGRPDLQGRVTVGFIIGSTGSVQVAVVEKSDLKHGATEQCIAAAARRWVFPAPGGGSIVKVSYPFLLQQAAQ